MYRPLRQVFRWLAGERLQRPAVGSRGPDERRLGVDSGRRAAAVRHRLSRWLGEYELPGHRKATCWVGVYPELIADPFGEVWYAPDGPGVAVRDMQSFEPPWKLPALGPLCLLEDYGPEALDDRLLRAVGDLGMNVWS